MVTTTTRCTCLFLIIVTSLLHYTSCVPMEQEIFKWMADNKSCREIGEKCSTKYTKDNCCDSDDRHGNMECKYSKSDHDNDNETPSPPRRFKEGICCIRSERYGCSIDSECCDYNNGNGAFCDLDGKCRIGIKYLDSKFTANANQENEIKEDMDLENDNDFIQNEQNEHEKETHFLLDIEMTPTTIGVLVLFIFVLTVCCGMYVFAFRKEKQQRDRLPFSYA
mmetsp:Transcript_29421/g.25998  ORF Transcript_29421/g.25998 Transcript_29421/m.25998 type:complete len:222 (-) Transcript_29421:115-780(-)